MKLTNQAEQYEAIIADLRAQVIIIINNNSNSINGNNIDEVSYG